MTYPKHLLLSWGGSLFATDTWQCGVRFSYSEIFNVGYVGGVSGFCRDVLENTANDVKTWFLNPNSFHSGAATLEWVKFNPINESGHYADEGVTNEWTFGGSPVSLPSGVEPAEPQLAWAVSLVTAKKRGPAARGRFFVPIKHVALSRSTPVIGGGLNGQMADAAKAFLNSLNDWPGLGLPDDPKVAVVSNIGTGHHEDVIAVRVGDRVDTQRRRANAFPETYESRAL